MVYLFGGAFLLGASNDAAILGDSLYDGKEMADRGGVIVVTVNYRVGTLGFLSTGDARLPGMTYSNTVIMVYHLILSTIKYRIPLYQGTSSVVQLSGSVVGRSGFKYQTI